MPKLAPPPTVAPETWHALFAAASEFSAAEPWEYMYDSDAVGLIDPGTGETRIATVLGNAGEVFAAVIYRRAGLRWILAMLDDAPNPEDLNNAEGMDCLKLEFVPKRELGKDDLAVLKAAAFKPAGEAACGGLIEGLLAAGSLPEKFFLGGSRLQPALQPLCDALQIQLWPASSLRALDEAVAALSKQMSGRPM
jgi:hypothetical protein